MKLNDFLCSGPDGMMILIRYKNQDGEISTRKVTSIRKSMFLGKRGDAWNYEIRDTGVYIHDLEFGYIKKMLIKGIWDEI